MGRTLPKLLKRERPMGCERNVNAAGALRDHDVKEADRCRAEIAACEALLLAGHPAIECLCLALSDWSAELRILERTLPSKEDTPSSEAC
jgi:hypothetical protein